MVGMVKISRCSMRNVHASIRSAASTVGGGITKKFRFPATAAKAVSDALSGPLAARTLEKTQLSKYHAPGGLGFAAEDANDLVDRLLGRGPKLTGTSNAINGPDRIVNGVPFQSKYYQSASETVAAAFGSSSGGYRYLGQVLEVPRDQYQACVRLMRDRIVQGAVPGLNNPADAEKIVRRGTVTYKQAKNIARPGNVESLAFDAMTQATTSASVAGIALAANFAQGCRGGANAQDAMRAALKAAFSTGSKTLVTGVVSAQVLRTRLAATGIVPARHCVRAASHTRLGRQVVQRIAMGSLGKPVYGAAATNHVSKLLRTNVVTATAVVAVTTTPDFCRAAFGNSMSWRQFTIRLLGERRRNCR